MRYRNLPLYRKAQVPLPLLARMEWSKMHRRVRQGEKEKRAAYRRRQRDRKPAHVPLFGISATDGRADALFDTTFIFANDCLVRRIAAAAVAEPCGVLPRVGILCDAMLDAGCDNERLFDVLRGFASGEGVFLHAYYLVSFFARRHRIPSVLRGVFKADSVA